ncbi:MAG: response regulator transcription factor [Marinobacterium sp.]
MELFVWSERKDIRERWQTQLAKSAVLDLNSGSLLKLPNGAVLLLHWSALDSKQRQELTARSHDLRLVALVDTPSDQEGIELLQEGFRGYANTFIQGALLTELVMAVGRGDIWAGPELLQRLLRRLLQQSQPSADVPAWWSLSERESQVMAALKRGESNKEIARELNITERTVKAHVSAILEKAGARDRIDLILKANGQVYPH